MNNILDYEMSAYSTVHLCIYTKLRSLADIINNLFPIELYLFMFISEIMVM